MTTIRDVLPIEFKKEMKLLLGDEYDEFISSYDKSKTNAIRVNTLKIGISDFKSLNVFHLNDKDDNCLPWSKESFYIDDKNVSPGKNPLHDAGAFYIQEPSAISVVGKTDIEENEKILDMCAAPGGKSTYILSKLKNTGILVSNEINPIRVKSLGENLERFGAINSIITNTNSKELLKFFKGYFDKVFIDAPCSGQGMFRKDEYAIEDWSEDKVKECVSIQKELIRDGYDMLKQGGLLVYSTCTFTKRENEDIIYDFIEKSNAQLVDMERIWPHKYRGEGHFCARLRKPETHIDDINNVKDDFYESSKLYIDKKNNKKNKLRIDRKSEHVKKNKLLVDFQNLYINNNPKFYKIFENNKIISNGDLLYSIPSDIGEISLDGLKILRKGLFLGELKKNRFEPSHTFAMALKVEDVKYNENFSYDSEEILKYISGESLYTGKSRGWVLVTVEGVSIGWGKESNGVLKNKYPKGLRR